MLSDARAKLSQGRAHIQAITALLVEEGSRLQRLVNKAAPGEEVPLNVLNATPERLALMASDALHNLRGSLDHMVYALGVAEGSVNPMTFAFPMGKDERSFNISMRKCLSSASGRLQTFVAAQRPFGEGGDPYLWALHALNNIDKHRRLLLTADPQVTMQGFVGVGIFVSAYYVKIGEGEPMAGEYLDATLYVMADRVQSIIEAAELEFGA